MVQGSDEHFPNRSRERMHVSAKLCYVKRSRTHSHVSEHDVTLITSAPSTVRVAPDGVMKPLRLACTIIEFGRTTELEVCEPKRSSGSQSSCCIRSTASCDTRGNDGKRKVCFQFKIFCRVRWRYGAGAEVRTTSKSKKRVRFLTELLTNGGYLKPTDGGYITQLMPTDAKRGCLNTYPYKHSNMMTPKLHQSQE
jgi:hypothetical protein